MKNKKYRKYEFKNNKKLKEITKNKFNNINYIG